MNPELAKALLAVQQEAPKLQRDGINPHFGSEYVTLEALMTARLTSRRTPTITGKESFGPTTVETRTGMLCC